MIVNISCKKARKNKFDLLPFYDPSTDFILQAARLQLPRVINDDGKRHSRRINSYEPPQVPFPTVQVAEKYRREFQEYKDTTLHLPTQTQNGLKKKEFVEDQDIKVPDITTPLANETELVGEINNNANESCVEDLKRQVESNTPSCEEKSDGKL